LKETIDLGSLCVFVSDTGTSTKLYGDNGLSCR